MTVLPIIDAVIILAVCLVIQRMLIIEVIAVIVGLTMVMIRKRYISRKETVVAGTQTEGLDGEEEELRKRIAQEVLQEINGVNGCQLSPPFYTQWNPQQFA